MVDKLLYLLGYVFKLKGACPQAVGHVDVPLRCNHLSHSARPTSCIFDAKPPTMTTYRQTIAHYLAHFAVFSFLQRSLSYRYYTKPTTRPTLYTLLRPPHTQNEYFFAF